MTGGPEVPWVPVGDPDAVFGCSVVVVPLALTATSPLESSTSTGVGEPAHRHPATPGEKLGSPLGVPGQEIGSSTGGAVGSPVGIRGDVGAAGGADDPVDPLDSSCVGVGVGVAAGAGAEPPPLVSVVKETIDPYVQPAAFLASNR